MPIADNIIKDVTPNGTDEPDDVNILGITPTDPADESVIDVAPIENQDTETAEQNPNEIVLTVIEDKPESPELPDTAFVWEQDEEVTPEDVQAYEELDPALKNPDVMPNITPEPVQAEKPNNNEVARGTINEKNEIYIPGFGWIPYEGPNVGITHDSVSEQDWDWTQIGNMG
jgi:cell envelope opacity-associated protein A